MTRQPSKHHVAPPDVTGSNTGELVAGIIAAVAFLLVTLSIASFLNRRRRWFFALVQLAILAASIFLLRDPTTGPSGVPVLLLVTSSVSFGLALLPVSHRHVRASRTVSRVELAASAPH